MTRKEELLMNTNPSKTKLLAALAAIVPVLAQLAQLVNALAGLLH
jgi:hypothetical protein